jgi:hypothetical protein
MTARERSQALQGVTDMANAFTDLERKHNRLCGAVRDWWYADQGTDEKRSRMEAMLIAADLNGCIVTD